MHRALWFCRLLLLVAVCTAATPGFARDNSGSGVYRNLLPKTVWVVVKRGDGTVTGSGFVAARTQTSYYIVTNHHVVENPRSPHDGAFTSQVKIYHPKRISGKLVVERDRYLRSDWGVDGSVLYTRPEKDLAIIGVWGKPPKTAWTAGDGVYEIATKSVQPGAAVYSVGNPGASGGLWAYSAGEVRQCYRARGREIVETTSPINPGDSGGPLVDRFGRIVGVNASYRVGARLVSHAVAGSEVADILKYGKSHGWFWLKNLNDVDSSAFPDVIKYYIKVGHIHWAAYNARAYIKRLRKAGKPTDAWTRMLQSLDTLQASTGRQRYASFQNKTKEVIIVYYRVYALTESATENYAWVPGDPDKWLKMVLRPQQAAYIRTSDGRPAPVAKVTYYARGTTGANVAEWRRRTQSFPETGKKYSSFGTWFSSFR